MSNQQNDIIAEDEQERQDDIQEDTTTLEEKLEAMEMSMEVFFNQADEFIKKLKTKQ